MAKGNLQDYRDLKNSINAVPKSVWQQTDQVFNQVIKDPNAPKKALATRFAIAEFKLNKWSGSEVDYRDIYKWVWLEKYMFVEQSYNIQDIKALGEQLLAGQQKYLTELGLIVASTGEILENQTVIIEQNGTILATQQQITTSVAGIETSIGGIQTAIGEIKVSIATITTNIGTLNANLVTIKDGVQYLITEVGLIRDDVSLIRTELGFIKDGIEYIKTDIGFIKNDINVITTELGFIKDGIEYIKTDVGFIKNDINVIKNDLGFIKDGIQYIKTELGYIRQTVDEIKVIATETLGTVKENQEILTAMQQNGVKILDKRNTGGSGGFDFTIVIYGIVAIVVLALISKMFKKS